MHPSERRMRWLALVVAAMIATISALASTSSLDDTARLVRHLPGGDASCHFLLMGMLAFVTVLGFGGLRVGGRPIGVTGCALVVATAVTADELSQLLLDARTFTLVDLAANYAGIAVFTALAAALRRRLLC